MEVIVIKPSAEEIDAWKPALDKSSRCYQLVKQTK